MTRNIAFPAEFPKLAKDRAHSCPKFVVVATLLALWFTTPINGVAQTTFGSPTNYPVGTQPSTLATADLDQDGRLDLAVVNTASNTVSILVGFGNGTFTTTTLTTANYAVGQDPVSIAVVDLNLDNKLDLAVAFHGDVSTAQTGGISLLLASGNGTFQPATTIASSDYPTGVATGDFNNDTKPDLAISNIDGSVSVFLGNGDGTFHSAVDYSVTGDASSVVVGDFNGDNKQDLAVTTLIFVGSEGLNGNASVLLGNGDGSFRPATETSLGGAARFGAVGDFNRDQKLDLGFIVKQTSVFGVPKEAIALGNGDGTFRSPQIIGEPAPAHADWMMVNDINEDGALDLVALDAGALNIYPGQGDGSFQPPQTVFNSPGPGGIAIGDFDGDLLVDLAVTMSPQNVVGILLNTTTTFALSLSPLTPVTLLPGQAATSVLTVRAGNGFIGGPVSLACSVQPTPPLAPECAINSSSVNLNSATSLTIRTTGPTTARAFPSRRPGLLYAVWLPVCGLTLVGIGFGSPQAKKRKLLGLVLCGVVFTGLIFQAACGGGGSSSGDVGSRRNSGWQLRDHDHRHIGIDKAFHDRDTHGSRRTLVTWLNRSHKPAGGFYRERVIQVCKGKRMAQQPPPHCRGVTHLAFG